MMIRKRVVRLVSGALIAAGLCNSGIPAGYTRAARARQSGELPQLVDVFVAGADGYKSYRIPSIIVGPKGTLLAFCEGRKFWSTDESPTDLVLRRSRDGGRTWLPMQVIVRAVPEAAMDPCPVVDRMTGEIVLVYDRWPELVKEHWPKNYTRKPGFGRDSITAWVMMSADDGATWSEPVDITATTKRAEWANIIHGPGIGIQTRSGRLVIPCSRLSPEGWWNFTIHSDDHGKTWQLGGTTGPGVDESQVIELKDGTLMLNMRSNRRRGCRAVATSRDGGNTWSEVADAHELPAPVCQASIIRYSPPEGAGTSPILFSSPGQPEKRERLTVRLSEDEAKTWPVSRLVYEGYSGYSCLAVLPDGSIGCLFERDNISKLSYARFSLDWLKGGTDQRPVRK